MSPERWRRIKDIAAEAMELEPEQRAEFFDAETGGDTELRKSVEKLIAADARPGNTFEQAIASVAAEANSPVERGRQFSHYQILDRLGEGGMGVVYKADDTKLGRSVALKFLAPHLLEDEDARKRFEREARAAASLDHPNICTTYEIDEADGQTYLAMAYIDGPSLAEKIKERPLPLNEALDLAIQIAEGLQEAHDKGVVHRDIKPQNIMLTAKGQVKIMDFGLASLAGRSRLTKSGTTLGTPAYMSPEQLEAKEVDRRADIWALGCVLYEMLTQRTPFDADYEQAIAYGILNEAHEPVTARRSGLPVEIDRIVAKALAKERDQRYQHADDLLVDLRALAEKLKSGRASGLSGRKPPTQLEPAASNEGAQSAAPAPAPGAAPGDLGMRRTLRLHQALVGAAVLLAATVSFMHFSEAPTKQLVSKWSFTPEALPTNYRPVAMSPNGRHIAYVAGSGAQTLWVRDLDQFAPRRLPQTEGAESPFWSPDSEFVAFGAGGALKKISVRGRTAITICSLPSTPFWGGAWSANGERVVFSSGGPASLFEVSVRGGEAERLFDHTPMSMGPGVTSPHFLPVEAGAEALVFDVGDPTHRVLAVRNLETGEWEALGAGAYPIYSPSGHILYQTNRYETGLWALPFSIKTLKPTGEAFPIADNGGFSSVAEDGTLVSVELRGGGPKQLVWRDRAGEKLGKIGQPQKDIQYPALSPDDRRVAVGANDGDNMDVWVHEVERPVKRRLTFDAQSDSRPQWSPSGREITYQSNLGESADIVHRAADGTGDAELLLGTGAVDERPYGWSRDGNYLVYTAQAENNMDLWYLKRKDGGEGFEPVTFLATPFDESAPNVSPDGRFLAYCSNASGVRQVYVRPFPSGDGQWQVSANGGCQTRWSRDGKELFYVQGETLMAVQVTTTPSFVAVSTTPLFSDPHLFFRGFDPVSYDVSADGRFVLTDSVENTKAEPPSINVVENWYEEFRGREQD